MDRKISAACILGAGCLWGTIGIFVRKISAYGLDSLQITFFRALVTAVVLTGCLLASNPRRLRVRAADLRFFFGTGVCSIAFFNFCYFQTIRMTSLSVAATLLYTAPVFVTFLSALLFHEALTLRKAAALVLALLGCAFVTGAAGNAPAAVPVPALLFGIGSGFGYALYSIFGRYALRRYGFLTVTAYTFLFAAAGCLPFSHPAEAFRKAQQAPELCWFLVCMGIVTSVVPYLLYTYGLGHVESSRASIMASVEPVTATLIGSVFFREPVTLSSAAGSVLVLFAIFLLSGCCFPGRKRGGKHAGEQRFGGDGLH